MLNHKKTKMKKQLIIVTLLLLVVTGYSQNKLQSTTSFEKGLNTWQYGTWGDATDEPGGFISKESSGQDALGGCARIQVDKTTKHPNKIFLRSPGVKLEKGKKYKLTFWVKSDAKNSVINVQFYSDYFTGSFRKWGGILSKEMPIKGDNSWEKLSLVFTAKDQFENSPIDYDAVSLSFGFSKYKGTYYIDNVSVLEI